MKMESNLRFQSWFDAEIEWARSLRRRKLMVFLKCIGITVIVALLVGLVGYFMDANSDSDTGLIIVAAVIFSVVLVIVILFFTMLPGLLTGSYKRKIRRAMKRQGFSEVQQEQFAKEQMAARNDPSRAVALDMTGFGQDHMPARFTISERYACLSGGMNYGPYIVRLEGTEAVRVSSYSMSVPTIVRIFGFVVSKREGYNTYLIQFVGQGKEQGRIELSDRSSCDKVLDVLRQRFPVTVG